MFLEKYVSNKTLTCTEDRTSRKTTAGLSVRPSLVENKAVEKIETNVFLRAIFIFGGQISQVAQTQENIILIVK